MWPLTLFLIWTASINVCWHKNACVSHPLVPPLTQRTFSHIQKNPPWSHQLHNTHMHTSDHVQETSAICPHSVTRYHIAPVFVSHPRITTKTTSTRTFLDICAVFDVPLISRQNSVKQRASAKVECTYLQVGSDKRQWDWVVVRNLHARFWFRCGGMKEKLFARLGSFVRGGSLIDAGCVSHACNTKIMEKLFPPGLHQMWLNRGWDPFQGWIIRRTAHTIDSTRVGLNQKGIL